MTNEQIQQNYQDEGGPEIKRETDDSAPTVDVVIACLGMLAMLAGIIYYWNDIIAWLAGRW